MKHKSLITKICETIDQHRAEKYANAESPIAEQRRRGVRQLARHLVPNIGSVLLVLIILNVLPSAASALQSTNASSVATIPYQGRLADSSGTPITAMANMEFRLYDVPTGGVPLWEEMWTGGNAVNVSDGLFSVMLGSLNTGIASVVDAHVELYLGITVGTDTEMAPRVHLGSVPFSMRAMTVPDASVTTAKIADGAVTQAKLGDDISLLPPDGSITSLMLADGAVTSSKMAPSWYYDYNPDRISTTSTTFQPTGVSVSFTCDTDCTAFIVHRTLLQHSSVNGRVDVSVLLDGNAVFAEAATVNTAFGNNNSYESAQGSGFFNVPSGTHTVEVKFACNFSTPGTCYYYGDYTRQFEHLYVMVFAQP